MQRTTKYYFLLALCLLVLDQLSKVAISNYFELGESITLSSFFSLIYVHNYGAAFSIFADGGGWQRYFLAAVSVIASVVIAIWIVRDKNINKLCLTLLLAGALGNLVDRVVHGYVIDFIALHYQQYYWPIFNIADVFISIGVLFLIIDSMKSTNST